jgi:hypothetical protein
VTKERRREPRYKVAVPIKVDGVKYGLAVTHDASHNGLLIVLASNVEVGKTVTVAFQGSPPNSKPIRATVVRSDRNEDDPRGLWPFRMALHLEEPIADLDTLRALSQV